MIYFAVSEEGSFSMRYFLEEEGRALAGRMRIVNYEELPRLDRLPLATWVFTEIDRLHPAERDLVAIAWERLRSAGEDVRLMNHPQRVRSRHDLLRSAHDAGQNRFRAFHASRIVFRLRPAAQPRHHDAQPAAALRYPVFVRFDRLHTGSLTPLLDSPRSLETALASLAARIPLHELLVVEFCDTRDEHGIFHKYSAYMVGDRILPRYLECSRDWEVKWHVRIFDRARARLEARYLETNPHAAWIRETFRLAGVDYGRIDYGVLAGEPQVWEINTNPTIGRGPGPRTVQSPDIVAYKEMLAPAFAAFYRNFLDAWAAVDSRADSDSSVELRAPRPILRAIEVAARRRRRAHRVGRLVRSVTRRSWMQPFTRGVKRALVKFTTLRLRRAR